VTGRQLLVTAGGVAAAAAVGLAVRPLLPVAAHRAARVEQSAARPVPGLLVRLAVATAAADLACAPSRARAGRDCGRLTVADTAGYFTGPATAQVRLVGTVTTAAGSAVPVALRIRLTHARGAWAATVIAP
jgi:hypothetical protein